MSLLLIAYNRKMPGNLGKVVSGPGFFRFVLALVVMVNHSSRVIFGLGAVFLFFVLSGYWITVMWAGRYSRADKPYLIYLASRAWRLLPTLWLIFLIAIAGLALDGGLSRELLSAREIFSHLFLLGYRGLDYKLIEAAWSLDIEAQFYLIAPFLLVLGAMLGRRAWWALVPLAWVLSLATWDYYPKGTIIQNIAMFAMGMAAATMKWRPTGKLAGWGVAAALLVVIALALSPLRSIIVSHRVPTALFNAYNAPFNALVAALLVPFAIWTTSQKGGPHDRMFGDLSYVVYLLHMPVFYWLAIGEGSTVHRAVMTLLAFNGTLGLGWLVWRYFDFPVNRARARWVDDQIQKSVARNTGPSAAEISGP